MTSSVQGNPDEIWIHRKGRQDPYLSSISELQACQPPVNSVDDFRKHLKRVFPDYAAVPSDHIYIQKYGENGALSSDTPITDLGGNTEITPHPVWTKADDFEELMARFSRKFLIIFPPLVVVVFFTFAVIQLTRGDWLPAWMFISAFLSSIGLLYNIYNDLPPAAAQTS